MQKTAIRVWVAIIAYVFIAMVGASFPEKHPFAALSRLMGTAVELAAATAAILFAAFLLIGGIAGLLFSIWPEKRKDKPPQDPTS